MRSSSLAVSFTLAVATLAAFTACIAPTPPTPTPTIPTATTTPVPSPTTDPEPAAERIVISTAAIAVVADDGAILAEFDYFQPTDDVLAGLSAYLGEPVGTEFEGGNDTPPAIYNDWDGLRLVDSNGAGAEPYEANHWLRVTGPQASGLQVEGPGGVLVGSSLDSTTGSDVTEFTNPETGRTFISYRLDVVPVEVPGSDSLTAEHNLAVMIGGYLDTGVVEHIIAPSPNFGA